MPKHLRALWAAGLVALCALWAPRADAQAVQVPNGKQCFQAVVGISGMIGTLGTITPGSGGASGTYTTALTGGSGTGATASITVSGGGVTAIAIQNPGTQYQVADVLSASSASIGNVTGFSVPVNSTAINSSLSGGSVGMYVPGTLTTSQTWQNAAQTVQNTNPITLDANGCALIYGIGTYRQIVYDNLGNVIWDQPTSVAPVNPYYAGLSSGTANAITVTDGGFSGTDGQAIQFIASQSNTGAATLNPSSFGAVPIVQNGPSGPIPLIGREIVLGNLISVVYSASLSEFILINSNTNNYPVIDVLAYGAIGDGTTNDTAAIQAAFTAAQYAGGLVRFPCGTFKTTAQETIYVNQNQNVTIQGSGPDCTFLYVSGANGISIGFAGPYSSAVTKDMTFLTDQSGGDTGLIYSYSGSATGAFVGQSSVQNVIFRGFDNGNAQYWGTGFSDVNVSNLNIQGLTYIGAGIGAGNVLGTAIFLGGSAASGSYATNINISNSFLQKCVVGVYYADFTQNVSISGSSINACQTGVSVASSPAGSLTGLLISSTSFSPYSCGVCIGDTSFGNFVVGTSLFSIPNAATGIQVNGYQANITGNGFYASSTSGSIAINYPSAGLGSLVASNYISGFGAGLNVPAGINAGANFRFNKFASNTNDYAIGSGASNVVIDDDNPRNYSALPTCNSSIQYSRFLVVDANTTTFNATLGGGSSNMMNALCNGSNWLAH